MQKFYACQNKFLKFIVQTPKNQNTTFYKVLGSIKKDLSGYCVL